MTACRESLVFLKHAILALVFAMSTQALLKKGDSKTEYCQIGIFLMLSNVHPFSPRRMIILDHTLWLI